MDHANGARQEIWVSGHLYYHQSLDAAVKGFVHPLVLSLVKAGQVDAFFFVRYSLGGPHVRLRLRITPGFGEEVVLEEMQHYAKYFLEAEPSTSSVKEEVIRRTNESILAGDPNETDGTVYSDNWFRIASFRPEVDRYGGFNHFRDSLAFFTLSSVAALQILSAYAHTSRSALLSRALQVLLDQAIGFAASEEELAQILGYAVVWYGSAVPKIVEKADGVADSQSSALLQVFRDSLNRLRSPIEEIESTPSNLLVAGSRKLSATLLSANRETRYRIGASQLHMTATRLGLSNAEEVYLGRLLTISLKEALAAGQWASGSLQREADASKAQQERFSSILARALRVLVALPPNRSGGSQSSLL